MIVIGQCWTGNAWSNGQENKKFIKNVNPGGAI